MPPTALGWPAQHLLKPVMWLMWSVGQAFISRRAHVCTSVASCIYVHSVYVYGWTLGWSVTLNLGERACCCYNLGFDSCVSEPMNIITPTENLCIINQKKSKASKVKHGNIWASTARETICNENHPHSPPTHAGLLFIKGVNLCSSSHTCAHKHIMHATCRRTHLSCAG